MGGGVLIVPRIVLVRMGDTAIQYMGLAPVLQDTMDSGTLYSVVKYTINFNDNVIISM